MKFIVDSGGNIISGGSQRKFKRFVERYVFDIYKHRVDGSYQFIGKPSKPCPEYYFIDKIEMKLIDSLAAVGNDAAHNNPSLKQEDVKRLVHEIPNILQRR